MSNTRPGILVIGPGVSRFMVHLVVSVASGFAAHGYRVVIRVGDHDPELIEAWARNNGVSLVFDINQMIRGGGGWSPSVLYALWLENAYWIEDEERYKILANESADWSYFIFNPDSFNSQIPKTKPWSVLSPGVSSRTIYIPTDYVRPDISFAGFIPQKDLGNPAVARNAAGESIHLDDFVSHCPPEIFRQSSYSLERTHEALSQVCSALDCSLDPEAFHFFEDKIVRQTERSRILRAAIGVTNNVKIHGHPFWRSWEEFAPFYAGHIEEPGSLDALYMASGINLHNGTLNLHFRVFDCLAAGGFMLMLKAPSDDQPGEIESVFQPGEHYDSFEISDASDVMKRYLDDPAERNRIAQQGRKLVLDKHTWAHRAERVLLDLGFEIAREPVVVGTTIADIIDQDLQATINAAVENLAKAVEQTP